MVNHPAFLLTQMDTDKYNHRYTQSNGFHKNEIRRTIFSDSFGLSHEKVHSEKHRTYTFRQAQCAGSISKVKDKFDRLFFAQIRIAPNFLN